MVRGDRLLGKDIDRGANVVVIGQGQPSRAGWYRERLEAFEAAYPDEAMDLSEKAAVMRVCLESLPKKHRDVIFLRFYVNESLDGIATALNCSVGTVKSRLFHGLEKLRMMKALTANFREHKNLL